MNVGFVGLSHLGICYMIASAYKKINVYGFDLDSTRIKNLKNNKFEIEEKNLKKLKNSSKKYINFFDEFDYLINCNLIFISEDVKTDKKGKSDLSKVYKYLKIVTKNLNKSSTIVILSQVHPGFTRNIDWDKSKLFYKVETLVIGNAINRALNPERIIIGSQDSKLKKNSAFYKYLYKFNCPIIKMNYESAELSKISINMFLISSVSTANILASISEKIGADWSKIVKSLRLDKRIGKYSYIDTGLGLSGGNLERDLLSIINLSNLNKINPQIFDSYYKSSIINRNWAYNIFKKYSLNLTKGDKIGILGLTYKEGTNSIKNSSSIELLTKLINNKVYCYDPKANLSGINMKIQRCSNVIEVIKNSKVLFIMTKWPEFKKIKLETLKKYMKGKIIIDPYGILKNKKPNKYDFLYFAKGISKK